MLVELSIAYHEIKEVVLKSFKPTGNFKVDVLSTREDKRLALANKIGLAFTKGDGNSPLSPIASFNNGGLGLMYKVYSISRQVSAGNKNVFMLMKLCRKM
jgi:hypothetical protein